jgi:hypothetical protein
MTTLPNRTDPVWIRYAFAAGRPSGGLVHGEPLVTSQSVAVTGSGYPRALHLKRTQCVARQVTLGTVQHRSSAQLKYLTTLAGSLGRNQFGWRHARQDLISKNALGLLAESLLWDAG